MQGRKPEPLVLKSKDKKTLQQLLRDGQTPVRIARRAQILLSCAEAGRRVVLVSDTHRPTLACGQGHTALRERSECMCGQVDQNRTTVWRVCERYRNTGLEAALYDAPRAGRPRVFSRQRTSVH
jgi:hypothetical protein